MCVTYCCEFRASEKKTGPVTVVELVTLHT
jgi:hypothetical protein